MTIAGSPDDLLTITEVGALVGLSVETIRTYRRRGTFPTPDRHFERTPVWRRDTIEQWAKARRAPGRPPKG